MDKFVKAWKRQRMESVETEEKDLHEQSGIYSKLREECARKGFKIKDVPKDGDCALHAVIDQLCLQGRPEHNVASLRSSAVQMLSNHPVNVNFLDRAEFDSFDSYLKQQSVCGTWCDELMIRRVSDVVDRKIVIIDEHGHVTSIVPQADSSSEALHKPPLFLGLMTDFHYVSLVPKDRDILTGHLLDEAHETVDESIAESECVQSKDPEVVGIDPQYPKCWSPSQWLSFQAEYPWLTCTNGSLGCSTCATVKVVGPAGDQGTGAKNQLSTEWINSSVRAYGTSRSNQLRSLRKKIWDHKKSAAHNEANKILEMRKRDSLKANVISQKTGEYRATSAVFRTAYYLAKNNRPFTDHSALIDLQRFNGVDVGRVLHSPTTCVDIVDHISQDMRKEVIKTILDSGVPFSVLIDESTTVSGKSCVVVYIRCSILNCAPDSYFLDLLELPGTKAAEIVTALLGCLHKHKFTDTVLQSRWLALGSDGASVMLGRSGGVIAKLQEKFPKIIGWHCFNHRLELSVHDVVKSVTAVNHFKAFIDKLSTLYSRSPKAKRELNACAAELGSQVYKIGRVLDVRWASSSLRTVSAVWRSYASLHRHFLTASTEMSNESRERALYDGLRKKLANHVFLRNLAVMHDALEELSDLSDTLQKNDVTLAKANRNIERQIDIFRSRKDNPGSYYKEALAAIVDGQFRGVALSHAGKQEREINCQQFYQGLVDSMTARLMSADDLKFRDLTSITQSDIYQRHFAPDHGERELRELCIRFNLPFGVMKDAFRDFKESKGTVITADFQKLLFAIDTIPVSTAACERGFSAMNDICTSLRSLLTVAHISSCMYIRTVGPPLSIWKPQRYVKSWLAKDRRDATSLKGMARHAEVPAVEEVRSVWRIFE